MRALLFVLLVGIAVVASADLKPTTKRLSSVQKGRWDAKASYPAFGGTSAVAKLANSTLAGDAKKMFDEFVKDARAGGQIQRELGVEYAFELSTVIGVATTDFISVFFDGYFFTGGAHPNTNQMPYTFGMVGGKAKRLGLADLVTSKAAVGDVMNKVVRPRLNAAKKERGGDPIDKFDPGLENSFVVTKAGLTWLFPPYAVGPYAEGGYQVKVPFADLAPYLRSGGVLKGVWR